MNSPSLSGNTVWKGQEVLILLVVGPSAARMCGGVGTDVIEQGRGVW